MDSNAPSKCPDHGATFIHAFSTMHDDVLDLVMAQACFANKAECCLLPDRATDACIAVSDPSCVLCHMNLQKIGLATIKSTLQICKALKACY